MLYFNYNFSGHFELERWLLLCTIYLYIQSTLKITLLNQQWFSIVDFGSWIPKDEDHPVLGRRLYNWHLKNGLPSCLNHCAWPPARPEPVSPSVRVVFIPPWKNARDGLCFKCPQTNVHRSPAKRAVTPFPFCNETNEIGLPASVLYRFYQFHGGIIFDSCQESAYCLLKNWNAACVWWCHDGCGCVSPDRL